MTDPDPPNDTRLVVIVVRTGGVGGIRRRWKAEPADDEAPHWIALIEQCPWDAPTEADAGADRFVWSIRARTPDAHRERELPDSELAGPWRDLVAAVRKTASDEVKTRKTGE
jgi:hypothetical protein